MKTTFATLAGAILSAALIAAPDAALAQVNENTKSAAEAVKKDPKQALKKAPKKKNMKEKLDSAAAAKKAQKK